MSRTWIDNPNGLGESLATLSKKDNPNITVLIDGIVPPHVWRSYKEARKWVEQLATRPAWRKGVGKDSLYDIAHLYAPAPMVDLYDPAPFEGETPEVDEFMDECTTFETPLSSDENEELKSEDPGLRRALADRRTTGLPPLREHPLDDRDFDVDEWYKSDPSGVDIIINGDLEGWNQRTRANAQALHAERSQEFIRQINAGRVPLEPNSLTPTHALESDLYYKACQALDNTGRQCALDADHDGWHKIWGVAMWSGDHNESAADVLGESHEVVITEPMFEEDDDFCIVWNEAHDFGITGCTREAGHEGDHNYVIDDDKELWARFDESNRVVFDYSVPFSTENEPLPTMERGVKIYPDSWRYPQQAQEREKIEGGWDTNDFVELGDEIQTSAFVPRVSLISPFELDEEVFNAENRYTPVQFCHSSYLGTKCGNYKGHEGSHRLEGLEWESEEADNDSDTPYSDRGYPVQSEEDSTVSFGSIGYAPFCDDVHYSENGTCYICTRSEGHDNAHTDEGVMPPIYWLIDDEHLTGPSKVDYYLTGELAPEPAPNALERMHTMLEWVTATLKVWSN